MKRIIFLLLIFFLAYNSAYCQDLSTVRQGSYYKYFYRINNNEAEKIIKKGLKQVDESWLYNLTDSIPVDSFGVTFLIPGNYLEVKTKADKLVFTFSQVNNVFTDIIDNERDLLISVSDSLGNIIENANVQIDGRKIKYDSEIRAYKDEISNQKGLLTIEYNNNRNFYRIERKKNNPAILRAGKSVVNIVPVRYVWYPVKLVLYSPYDLYRTVRYRRNYGLFYYVIKPFSDVYRSIAYFNATGWVGRAACLFDAYYCDRYYPTYGFMVNNKPQYRSGDTVMMKAWVVNKKARPINRKALLYTYDKNHKRIILDTINPYRKGSYKSEFVLSDSLNLRQSQGVSLFLETKRGRDLLFSSFFYEDYELKSLNGKMRIEHENHYRSTEQKLYLDLTDENGLVVPDGRFRICIVTDFVSSIDEDKLFIKDTLWISNGKIDPSETTEIPVPDSVFPSANLTYKVFAVFNTSSNETVSAESDGNFFHKHVSFQHEEVEDSISLKYMENEKSISRKAKLQAFGNNNNLVYEGLITLPGKVKPHENIYNYLLSDGERTHLIPMAEINDNVILEAIREADSLKIQISNIRNLDLSYFIYKKNRLIREGHSDNSQILEIIPTNTDKNYHVVLNYKWADDYKTISKSVEFYKNNLDVTITHPQLVYPGQDTSILITVSDADGNPVKDAELTAWGITSKFNYEAPQPPYFGKRYRTRIPLNGFNVNNIQKLNISKDLNWELWKIRMYLDSLEFYKFLYPESGYHISTYKTGNKFSEFSPYIIINGEVQQVYIIYVDDVPVYFQQANHINPYSFRISEGLHNIRIRTKNKNITFKHLNIGQGTKTFLSIDPEKYNKSYKVTSTSQKYTRREQILLNNKLIWIKRKFSDSYPHIEQGQNVLLLSENSYNNYLPVVAGPINRDEFKFHQPEYYKITSFFENNYTYEFNKYGTKMYQKYNQPKVGKKLPYNKSYGYSDRVFTDKMVEDLYKLSKIQKKQYRFTTYPASTYSGNGQILLITDSLINKNELLSKAKFTMIVSMEYPSESRVYPMFQSHISNLIPGIYSVLILRDDSSYYEIKTIEVKAGTWSCAKIPTVLSNKNYDQTIQTIEELLKGFYTSNNLNEIQRNYYEQIYFEPTDFENGITANGIVLDMETGEPLIGVTILVRGTSIGTIADLDGRFSLKVPEGSVLEANYIGFNSAFILSGPNLVISMEPSSLSLDEVVVTGYGTSRRTDLTGSVSVVNNFEALKGRVAGVTVLPGVASQNISIRGISSLNNTGQILYIINGIPVSNPDELNITPEHIKSIEVINDDSYVSKYGSLAANGVILITTHNEINLPRLNQFKEELFASADSPASGIRSNFSDFALWEPSLITDKKGEAVIKLKFPDDITMWNNHVIAVNGKYTGSGTSSIRSYKPVAARLDVNRFLIEGDTTNVIGKSLNYQNDSIKGVTSFSLSNSIKYEKNISFLNVHLDTFMLSPISTDSLNLTYKFEKENGYYDGEVRSIPVYPKGIIESSGIFLSLNTDTSFNYTRGENSEKTIIYAKAGLLDVLLDEVKSVRNYPYWCNEQTASKLRLMIREMSIYEIQGKPYYHKQEIRNLINKLQKDKNDDHMWGWWPNGESSVWVTAHVINALLDAREAGFIVDIDMGVESDILLNRINASENLEKIRILRTLHRIDTLLKLDDQLLKIKAPATKEFQAYLEYLLLLQDAGQKPSLDSLWESSHNTVYGNIYWQEDRRYPDYNNNLTTLKAYELIRRDSVFSDSLVLIRNYFLEERKGGYWRNTYESCEIVSAILPDLIGKDKQIDVPSVKFSGGFNKIVSEFPFTEEVVADESIQVKKTGKIPVYLSVYEQFRNKNPEPVNNKDFIIRTWFDNDSDSLIAGEAIKLNVEITVKRDADYVMVEVPIPGSCSYNSKSTGLTYRNHVEFLREKTSVFYRYMKAGTYTFSIDLLPRYTGRFYLNPAKAELMYFPVDYGRNQGRDVLVN